MGQVLPSKIGNRILSWMTIFFAVKSHTKTGRFKGFPAVAESNIICIASLWYSPKISYGFMQALLNIASSLGTSSFVQLAMIMVMPMSKAIVIDAVIFEVFFNIVISLNIKVLYKQKNST